MNTYDLGNLVQLQCTFTNAAGAPVDPTAVTLTVRVPDTSYQTFNYPGTITKVSTGVYIYQFQTSESGLHGYRYSGTGAVVANQDGQFMVSASAIQAG